MVRDTGRGLPVDFDLKRAGEKSLGMRMIRSLIRQIRGDLKVERERGAAFTLVAPLSIA